MLPCLGSTTHSPLTSAYRRNRRFQVEQGDSRGELSARLRRFRGRAARGRAYGDVPWVVSTACSARACSPSSPPSPWERPRARPSSPPPAPSRRRAGRATSRHEVEAHAPRSRAARIRLVNRFRSRHGLRPLKLDPGLRFAARARGVIDKGRTARLALYSPTVSGGRRAQGRPEPRGRDRAHWLKQPGAREVLLLPWARRIGVGVRVGTSRASDHDHDGGSRSATEARDGEAAPIKPNLPSKPAPPPPVARSHACPPAPSGPVVGLPTLERPPGVRVVGTASDSRALIHLAAGCTGTLASTSA